jgi:hypothetical protein
MTTAVNRDKFFEKLHAVKNLKKTCIQLKLAPH